MKRKAVFDPKQTKLYTPKASCPTPQATTQGYDMLWHKCNFDAWQHGYIWKGGRMWYRRPDGVDVLAPSAVNELTESGELLAKCEFPA